MHGPAYYQYMYVWYGEKWTPENIVRQTHQFYSLKKVTIYKWPDF